MDKIIKLVYKFEDFYDYVKQLDENKKCPNNLIKFILNVIYFSVFSLGAYSLVESILFLFRLNISLSLIYFVFSILIFANLFIYKILVFRYIYIKKD